MSHMRVQCFIHVINVLYNVLCVYNIAPFSKFCKKKKLVSWFKLKVFSSSVLAPAPKKIYWGNLRDSSSVIMR